MSREIKGKEYMTPPEAATQLGVSRMTVIRWVSDKNHPMHGKIGAYKHPLTNRYYLKTQDVTRLAKNIRSKFRP